MRHRYR